MPTHVCETCGTQYADSTQPPARCAICEDERQYVGWSGQRWTTLQSLASGHKNRIEEEEGLTAFGITPAFGIDQRAFLLQTDAGNILWESLSLVTSAAVDVIRSRGGVRYIIVSHPHFYASMAEWSEAFDGAPILLNELDREWVQRPHPSIQLWSGDKLTLSGDVTLVRCGGHFPGSTALHWKGKGRPRGALFSGDALQVTFDRRHVSFMYSYPNFLPMRTSDVREMRRRIAEYDFDDVFGYTWGRNIIGGGRQAVDQSYDRYLSKVTA